MGILIWEKIARRAEDALTQAAVHVSYPCLYRSNTKKGYWRGSEEDGGCAEHIQEYSNNSQDYMGILPVILILMGVYLFVV